MPVHLAGSPVCASCVANGTPCAAHEGWRPRGHCADGEGVPLHGAL